MTKKDFMALFNKAKEDYKNWETEDVGHLEKPTTNVKFSIDGIVVEPKPRVISDYYAIRYYNYDKEKGYEYIEFRIKDPQYYLEYDHDIYAWESWCIGFGYNLEFEAWHTSFEDNDEKIEEDFTEEEIREIISFINENALYPRE